MKKTCPKCGVPKKLDEFPVNRTKKDGRGVVCLLCQREYVKDHYRKNRSYYLDKAEHRRLELNAQVEEIVRTAKSRPCADCGNSYHHCAMDFDHVRGKKWLCVSQIRNGRSLAALRKEIKKCEVVCAICHRLRTWRRNHPDEEPPSSNG